MSFRCGILGFCIDFSVSGLVFCQIYRFIGLDFFKIEVFIGLEKLSLYCVEQQKAQL